jgi:hypothetical protein
LDRKYDDILGNESLQKVIDFVSKRNNNSNNSHPLLQQQQHQPQQQFTSKQAYLQMQSSSQVEVPKKNNKGILEFLSKRRENPSKVSHKNRNFDDQLNKLQSNIIKLDNIIQNVDRELRDLQKDPRDTLVQERVDKPIKIPPQKNRNYDDQFYEQQSNILKFENSHKDRGEMLSQDRSYISM